MLNYIDKSINRGGFTLIELLVVITILGILATIAVPMFLGQRTRAMQKEAMTNLEAMRLLQEQYFAENGEYVPDAAANLGTCAANNPTNIVDIQGELPGFKPGRGEDLYFSYCLVQNRAIDTANPLSALVDTSTLAPPYKCFTAQAFGNSGTQVDGQEFRVDCNNVKTY
jgi:prepilin-type N-terminal cleavage/methylation domain-containing protein